MPTDPFYYSRQFMQTQAQQKALGQSRGLTPEELSNMVYANYQAQQTQGEREREFALSAGREARAAREEKYRDIGSGVMGLTSIALSAPGFYKSGKDLGWWGNTSVSPASPAAETPGASPAGTAAETALPASTATSEAALTGTPQAGLFAAGEGSTGAMGAVPGIGTAAALGYASYKLGQYASNQGFLGGGTLGTNKQLAGNLAMSPFITAQVYDTQKAIQGLSRLFKGIF